MVFKKGEGLWRKAEPARVTQSVVGGLTAQASPSWRKRDSEPHRGGTNVPGRGNQWKSQGGSWDTSDSEAAQEELGRV